MKLSTVTSPLDLARLQRPFTWDVGDVTVEFVQKDGEGGWRGASSGSILSANRKILLDSADILRLTNGQIILVDNRSIETLLHELYHVEQARRGFFYRLKMAWWRLTIPYQPELEYSPRPHEKEARLWAQEKVKNW